MTGPASASSFADLRLRVISGAVLALVGIGALWADGRVFDGLVLVICGLAAWELSLLTASGDRMTAAVMAVLVPICLTLSGLFPLPAWKLFLLVPALAFALTPRRDRLLAAAYALVIVLAGFGLIFAPRWIVLWLVAVVVVSDVAGYFVGRLVGGPKFWPAISPKKTWSGTVAGWLGALLVGFGFASYGAQPHLGLILMSPLLAFAGQLGDIAESWIKRRAGVKDASNLIPGHGGVMDRFDAMIGAAFLVSAIALVLRLGQG
jgi:phosphatidate cytidylyltransferase